MPLADYPSPPGNKPFSIHIVSGPNPYVAVTNGASPTGGQVVPARNVGLVSIEWAQGCCSNQGTYYAHVIFDGNPNRAVPQVRIRWIVAATGAEAAGGTDLSTHNVRILFIGQ